MSKAIFPISIPRIKGKDCAKKLANPSNLTPGEVGEAAALIFLESKNYKIINQNWRCKAGEVDIICKQGADLVFVEVKTRLDSSLARANLFANIDARKKRKLLQLKDIYLARYKFSKVLPSHRIDLLGLVLAKGSYEPIFIEHVISGL